MSKGRETRTEERCEYCGGKLRSSVVPKYEDELLGLPDVVLLDSVEEIYCEDCGEKAGTSFPNMHGLIIAAAEARLRQPYRLRGRELYFLQNALDWSTESVAKNTKVSQRTVRQWQRGPKVIPPTAEAVIRLGAELRLLADYAQNIHRSAYELIQRSDKKRKERPTKKIYLRLAKRKQKDRPRPWQTAAA